MNQELYNWLYIILVDNNWIFVNVFSMIEWPAMSYEPGISELCFWASRIQHFDVDRTCLTPITVDLLNHAFMMNRIFFLEGNNLHRGYVDTNAIKHQDIGKPFYCFLSRYLSSILCLSLSFFLFCLCLAIICWYE